MTTTQLEESGERTRPNYHMPARVQDVMSSEVYSVEPAATVQEIAHIMLERDIRCVPVVDMGEMLVGVVSEADLITREGYPTIRSHHLLEFVDSARAERHHHWAARAMGLTAEELMTTEIVTCRPDEPLSVATRRMLREDVRVMPVVEGRTLVGILSRHDLLSLFDRPDAEIRARVSQVLADPLWAPDDHHVAFSVRDGVVDLEGSVRYASEVSLVSAIVGHVPGVVEVANHVHSEGPDPKPHYARDTDWR